MVRTQGNTTRNTQPGAGLWASLSTHKLLGLWTTVTRRSCSRGDLAGSALLDEVGNQKQTQTQGSASATVSLRPGLSLAPLLGSEAAWEGRWAGCGSWQRGQTPPAPTARLPGRGGVQTQAGVPVGPSEHQLPAL